LLLRFAYLSVNVAELAEINLVENCQLYQLSTIKAIKLPKTTVGYPNEHGQSKSGID
jgi:hypothetical protein